ncbi:MAG: hypothetical protein R3Y58_09205 [Eubacteriales bacterium]
MLESVFNSNVIYYVMGVIVAGGIISKMVVSMTLRRLVRAASDMSKSTHKFMKLVRAKFEHAYMVNDHVENISVFVDKYIYEYQVFRMRLYSWIKLEKIFAMLLGVVTLFACVTNYYYAGIGEVMLQRGMVGISLLVVLYAIYQLGDERFRIENMRVYMVDYLENVCAARYAKSHETKERTQNKKQDSRTAIHTLNTENIVAEKKVKKGLSRLRNKEITEEIQAEKLQKNIVGQEELIDDVADRKPTLSMVEKMLLDEAERRMEFKKQKEDNMPNEAAIREILQEFMA